ncbi:hypothetical protein Hanom_Chr17g01588661 [Helianthus anomalus]
MLIIILKVKNRVIMLVMLKDTKKESANKVRKRVKMKIVMILT